MKRTLHALRIPHVVADLIRALHPSLKRKIKAALAGIVADPGRGKTLKEELAELRSCKVSRFRIIYRVSHKTVEIIAVGPRGVIYAETFRLINKKDPSEDPRT